MSLKSLVLIKVSVLLFLVVLGFMFNVPVAYVPENASIIEFILLHLIFIVTEVIVISYIVIQMLVPTNMPFIERRKKARVVS